MVTLSGDKSTNPCASRVKTNGRSSERYQAVERSISNITAALGDAAVISPGLAEDPGATYCGPRSIAPLDPVEKPVVKGSLPRSLGP